jgi:hypothetical protein
VPRRAVCNGKVPPVIAPAIRKVPPRCGPR